MLLLANDSKGFQVTIWYIECSMNGIAGLQPVIQAEVFSLSSKLDSIIYGTASAEEVVIYEVAAAGQSKFSCVWRSAC